jgi:uncharacterized protein
MKRVALAAITAYQWLLSPYLGQACRFYPTCSAYSKEAIHKHGTWRGMWLTGKRLLRCRPGAAAGFDPVPDSD